MGLDIDREHFEPEDHVRFAGRLEESLDALDALLARPGFGEGATTVGAELEVSLVDADARPLPRNVEVLEGTDDPRLTVELDRFNLECNVRPTPLAGRPFEALRRELETAIAELARAAAERGGRVVCIGILPTLRRSDLERGGMTDRPRYRALDAAIRARRRGPFTLRIHGPEELETTADHVTFEGAATALQLHLRVAPARFADVFDAVQAATAPALAAAGNSPLFLGRRLWEETRVALFKQAVDDRGDDARRVREARVSFGRSWTRGGAAALFREAVALHAPLLPVLDRGESPGACVASGGVPRLAELRLHLGTIWNWNRPVYDPADGGHLRVEMRALPSGPTVTDMLANAAFLLGAGLGLAARGEAFRDGLSFDDAHHNFYRAAQLGLAAELAWPGEGGPRPVQARDLVAELLPVARVGLDAAGVEPVESEALLGVIERRAATGRTGAAWQAATLERLEARRSRDDALPLLLERYLEHAAGGAPVHTWPIP